MEYKFFSFKGKRAVNEDTYNIIDKNDSYKFFGIYDGHGGTFVSTFLKNNMPTFFADPNKINKKYIKYVFKCIQNYLKEKYYKDALHCGATCILLLMQQKDNKKYITTINSGDSRCIICRDNLAIPLTLDHKPNWPLEKKRIEALGGKIYQDGQDYRVGNLSVSRSFGDFDTQYVSADPDIRNHMIKKNDKFIVIGCDGLYDVLSDQEIVNFIICDSYDSSGTRVNKNINTAKKVAEYAHTQGSTDNITIIIIYLN